MLRLNARAGPDIIERDHRRVREPWNRCKAAVEMYTDFLRTGMIPNDVMSMAVLSTCIHSGLVSQDLAVFKSLQELGIVPRIEQCASIVDLLSKAGRVEEAARLVRTMPSKPSANGLEDTS